jgi:hypothetical protein
MGRVLIHHPAQSVTAEIMGNDSGGNPNAAIVDPDGNLAVDIRKPLSAFGEVLVANRTPQVQLQWPYEITSDLVIESKRGTATIAVSTSSAVVATGGTAGSLSRLASKRILKYEPGQGSDAIWTARFPSGGVVGTEAYSGLGDVEEGFFFGYADTGAFGILYRYGGQIKIARLVVTAGASGNGNLTITLNGVATTVAVLAGDSVGEVCTKIANAAFNNTGGGWRAVYGGDRVNFMAYTAETRAGAYTFAAGGTGVVAAFGTAVDGVAPTDTVIPQTTWNADKADGTGVLPALDPTKGNLYSVQFQYLGYGSIEFFIENSVTRTRVLVHRIPYGNANTHTSLRNPALPLTMWAQNGAVAQDVKIEAGSMGAFTQGFIANLPQTTRQSFAATKSLAGADVPLFSIRVAERFGTPARTTKLRVLLDLIEGANEDTSKIVTMKVWENVGLTGTPAFTSLTGLVQVDTAATGIVAGAAPLFTFLIRPVGSGPTTQVPSVVLFAGDMITITGSKSSAAKDVAASLSWLEYF